MNDHPSALYTLSFRMQRGDHVAMTEALSHRSPLRLAAESTGLVLSIALLSFALAGSAERWAATILQALSLPLAFATVPLLLAGPVILALYPKISGLVAALLYPRSPTAERDVTVHVTAQGMEGGATGFYSCVGWAAVTCLIETPKHLFIQLSGREALIIPRRALPDDDTYRNLVGFVRARTGLPTL